MRAPEQCENMAHIRAEIDRLDAALVTLLAERAAYIDRAAAIKAQIDLPARIDDRVEEVIANVRAHAAAKGLSPELAEDLWRRLVDWSIAREESHLGPDSQRNG